MNVTEMHIAVQQGVDKINSLQADSLLSEEIDIELNKNMFRFINTKYGRNNLYRKGFEESQKRIDDFNQSAIVSGIILGKQLGRKLQVRNTDRTLKSTRLKTGKIDKRLLSQLGFGNRGLRVPLL